MQRTQQLRSYLASFAMVLVFTGYGRSQTTLSLGSGSAALGGSVSVNLDLTGPGLAALQWTLSYPSEAIASLTVTAGPALRTPGKRSRAPPALHPRRASPPA